MNKKKISALVKKSDNHGKKYFSKDGREVPRCSTVLDHCQAPSDAKGSVDFAKAMGRRHPVELAKWGDVGTDVHAIAESVLRFIAAGTGDDIVKSDKHPRFESENPEVAAGKCWRLISCALDVWHALGVNAWDDYAAKAKYVDCGAYSLALWMHDALEHRDLKPFLIEAVSVSESMQFGCTSDLVCCIDGQPDAVILDFKTGKPKHKDLMQLAANTMAVGESKGLHVRAAGCVYLDKAPSRGPSHREVLWTLPQLRLGWREFAKGLELFNLRNAPDLVALEAADPLPEAAAKIFPGELAAEQLRLT